MLYNLQFVQALAALSSKFSPDERQAWSTAGVLKKVTGCKLEFLHSDNVQFGPEVVSTFQYHRWYTDSSRFNGQSLGNGNTVLDLEGLLK